MSLVLPLGALLSALTHKTAHDPAAKLLAGLKVILVEETLLLFDPLLVPTIAMDVSPFNYTREQ